MIKISDDISKEEENEEDIKISEKMINKLSESLKMPGLSALLPVFKIADMLQKISLPELALPEISLSSSNFKSEDLVLFEALSERLDIIEIKIDYIIEVFKILSSPEAYKKKES